jgi:hypothetical protein
MTDNDWRRLVRQVQQGLVVPVLGSHLLVAPDGRWLPAEAAARLLAQHGLQPRDDPAASFLPVGAAAARVHAECNVKFQDLYADASDAIDSVVADTAGALPPALLNIAGITDFRLLVTTTPDDLLVRALRTQRRVEEIVHAPSAPAAEARDLPADWARQHDTAFVLYLFGKARAGPMFALHEEDVLEYTHNIIARDKQAPTAFVQALQHRSLSLLLIGCSLPDWLGRFFLRLVNEERLSEKKRREWLVDPPEAGGGLVTFLRAFSGETEVLGDMPPAQFAAELHRRWLAARPAASEASGTPTTSAGGAAGTAPPTFFISYSRATDHARARRLVQVLRELGATDEELWFDDQSIDPGQNFNHRIADGIRACVYFVPLLSHEAGEREQAYVFREWQLANERLPEMNREFVIPIVVDAEFAPARHGAEPVRKWRELDFGHAPDGVPDATTRERLARLLRNARRRP